MEDSFWKCEVETSFRFELRTRGEPSESTLDWLKGFRRNEEIVLADKSSIVWEALDRIQTVTLGQSPTHDRPGLGPADSLLG